MNNKKEPHEHRENSIYHLCAVVYQLGKMEGMHEEMGSNEDELRGIEESRNAVIDYIIGELDEGYSND